MPTPEFFLGQNFLLGSVKGCKAVQQPNLVTISSRFQRDMHKDLLITIAPFATEYRIVYAEHRSPFQIQVEFTLIKRVYYTCSNYLVQINVHISFNEFDFSLENSSFGILFTEIVFK